MTRRLTAAEALSFLAALLSYVAALTLLLTRQVVYTPATLALALTLPPSVLGLTVEDVGKLAVMSITALFASLFAALTLATYPIAYYNPPNAGSYIEIVQAWFLRATLVALPLNILGAFLGRILREVISSRLARVLGL